MCLEIEDKRDINEFKGITFSSFKKTDAKKVLIKSIINSKIEDANYWTAEFVCAGHFLDLWEIIFEIITKHINLANPKLSLYINLRINNFKDILVNGYLDNELKLRNNSKIRKLFSEIISILCFSKKTTPLQPIKIDKNEFIISELSYRLKSDNLNYSKNIFFSDDPKELFIPINEFCFHISENNFSIIDACYWIEWILDFEKLCKRKKDTCKCSKRTHINVLEKFQNDIIWIIWDAILKEIPNRKNIHKIKHYQTINNILNSLLSMFCLHYNNSTKRKRKFFLYFSIYLLSNDINLTNSNNIINNKNDIKVIIDSIDLVYKNVKKNEIQPEISYLFNGLQNKNNNLEKTLDKINTLNNVSFIPRN